MESASVTSYGQQAQQVTADYDAFADLNLDEFLGLLITELQSQDPLNPMDNSEILQQVSQMREIESNTRLTETLQTVLLGQSMTTASSLLDRVIVGLTDDGHRVNGTVDRVSVVDGKPRLHVGEHDVDLDNVSEITAERE